MEMMIWYLVCLLIHSAVAVPAITAVKDVLTSTPASTNDTTNPQPTTSSPDKCHIVVQAYVNTGNGEEETCDSWETGYIKVNDMTVWNSSMCWRMWNKFGLNILQIEPTTCRIVGKKTYHTSERESEALKLTSDLKQVEDGSWLIGVTGNDASNQLKFALGTLEDLGVFVADVGYGGSFTFIVKKGNPKMTTTNKTLDNTVEPASLDVVIAEEITTTPAPTIQPTTIPLVPGQVLGCFRDVFGNRDLEHEVEWELIGDLNSNELCASECLKRGYKYAGCQMSVMCLCGINYGAYGFSNGCTMTCPGDKTQICGGRLANTVIYTGQGSVHPMTESKTSIVTVPTTGALTTAMSSTEEPATTHALPATTTTTIKPSTTTTRARPRHDCADILAQGHTASGVYTLDNGIKTYCDMTTNGGGWTVFQRRQDGRLDFYRNWNDYAAGFGTPYAEFWLGNDNLYTLASAKQYKLRVDLTDFNGNRAYAEYSNFKVGSRAANYKLISIGKYNAGDSLARHVGKQFTTRDQDHDEWPEGNCAEYRHGAWWYIACADSSLNSRYYNTLHDSDDTGVVWHHWHDKQSLKFSEMKIKPTNA